MRSRRKRRTNLIMTLTVLELLSGLFDRGFQSMRTSDGTTADTVVEASFHDFLLEPPHPAPELDLVDQHYNPFSLADHEGDLVVVFFGYTNCPDVYPATLIYYSQVKQELGPLAGRVRFVFPVGYRVNHSALSYVIDTDGNLRLALPFGVEPRDIAADLRQLL